MSVSALNTARYTKVIAWRDRDGFGWNRVTASGTKALGGSWDALRDQVDYEATQMALNLGFKPRSRWTRWLLGSGA